jgi:hypothetical protein
MKKWKVLWFGLAMLLAAVFALRMVAVPVAHSAEYELLRGLKAVRLEIHDPVFVLAEVRFVALDGTAIPQPDYSGMGASFLALAEERLRAAGLRVVDSADESLVIKLTRTKGGDRDRVLLRIEVALTQPTQVPQDSVPDVITWATQNWVGYPPWFERDITSSVTAAVGAQVDKFVKAYKEANGIR